MPVTLSSGLLHVSRESIQSSDFNSGWYEAKPGTTQVSIVILIIESRKIVTFLEHAPMPSLHLINNVLLYPHNKFLR